MGQNIEDVFWYIGGGQDVEEFYCFYFEFKIFVNYQQDNVGDFGDVDYGFEFVGVFDKG